MITGLGLSGLSCVYFALLLVGVLYALFILVTGGLHDAIGDIGGHDFDLGDGGGTLDGSVDVTHVSPVTLAGFVTAFGAFGIIAQSAFHAGSGASLVWASVGGVLVGLVSHLAFIYFFIKPQGSSEVTRDDVVGARAEVITSIPEGSVGEVAFVAQGGRVTMTARGVGGRAFARGSLVRIEERLGSVVLVRSSDDPGDRPADA